VDFEWAPRKARANFEKHSVDVEERIRIISARRTSPRKRKRKRKRHKG